MRFETLHAMTHENSNPVGASTSSTATRAASPPSGGWLLLALALALGLVRFVSLGEWSLWIDEVLTLADYKNRLDVGGIGNSLGYRLVRFGVALCGGRADEFGLRFLPACVGYAMIPTVFFALRPLAGGKRAGFCALVLAVSSWHVFWSQNARFYTFAQWTSFVGVALVLRAYLRGGVLSAVVGFALAGAAAMFHPSAALALPVLVALPFAAKLIAVDLAPSARRSGVVLALIALVGCVFAFAKVQAMWGEYSEVKSLASPVSLLLTTGFYITPLLGGLALVGALELVRRRDSFGRLVLCLVVVTFALALVVSLKARVVAQYVFFLQPWIVLLGCWILGSRSEDVGRSERRLLPNGVAFVLVVSGLVGCLLYMTKRMGERPRWREAYQFVAEQVVEGDGIFGMGAPIGEYYLSPQTSDYRRPQRIVWFDSYRPRLAEQWSKFDRKAWYVIHPKWFEDWPQADADRVREYLARECRLAASFPLNADTRDLSLLVYVRD